MRSGSPSLTLGTPTRALRRLCSITRESSSKGHKTPSSVRPDTDPRGVPRRFPKTRFQAGDKIRPCKIDACNARSNPSTIHPLLRIPRKRPISHRKVNAECRTKYAAPKQTISTVPEGARLIPVEEPLQYLTAVTYTMYDVLCLSVRACTFTKTTFTSERSPHTHDKGQIRSAHEILPTACSLQVIHNGPAVGPGSRSCRSFRLRLWVRSVPGGGLLHHAHVQTTWRVLRMLQPPALQINRCRLPFNKGLRNVDDPSPSHMRQPCTVAVLVTDCR